MGAVGAVAGDGEGEDGGARGGGGRGGGEDMYEAEVRSRELPLIFHDGNLHKNEPPIIM